MNARALRPGICCARTARSGADWFCPLNTSSYLTRAPQRLFRSPLVLHMSWLSHLRAAQAGVFRGEFCPSVGGTGVSPEFLFTTPFMIRKRDRGMVETASSGKGVLLGKNSFFGKPESAHESLWSGRT
jgi:hypothetical protein